MVQKISIVSAVYKNSHVIRYYIPVQMEKLTLIFLTYFEYVLICTTKSIHAVLILFTCIRSFSFLWHNIISSSSQITL